MNHTYISESWKRSQGGSSEPNIEKNYKPSFTINYAWSPLCPSPVTKVQFVTSSPLRAPGSQQQTTTTTQQHHRTELSQTAWHQHQPLVTVQGCDESGSRCQTWGLVLMGAVCSSLLSASPAVIHSFIHSSLPLCVFVVTWFKSEPSHLNCWSVKWRGQLVSDRAVSVWCHHQDRDT